MASSIDPTVIAAVKHERVHWKHEVTAQETSDNFGLTVTQVNNIAAGKTGGAILPAPLPEGFLLGHEKESKHKTLVALWRRMYPDSPVPVETMDLVALDKMVLDAADTRSAEYQDRIPAEARKLRQMWGTALQRARRTKRMSEKEALMREIQGYAIKLDKIMASV